MFEITVNEIFVRENSVCKTFVYIKTCLFFFQMGIGKSIYTVPFKLPSIKFIRTEAHVVYIKAVGIGGILSYFQTIRISN